MPMTITHALVPLAGALALSDRRVSWHLVAAACLASALPDADWIAHHFFNVPSRSIYAHRGAAHSLFAALAAGCIASALHKQLKAGALTAGVVVAAAMASHGILDMMTDTGIGVAYLWPLSSARLFADWRPIHSAPVSMTKLVPALLGRFRSEVPQLILPMFALAVVVRAGRALATRVSR